MKRTGGQAAVGTGRGPTVGAPRGSPTKTRVLLLFLPLAAAACIAAYFAHPTAPLAERFAVSLVRVSDGDTVVLRDARGRQYHVRLYGVDTPELGAADGFRAALYAATQLEAARGIELEPEPRMHRAWDRTLVRDRYGRVLGWVWYEDQQGRKHLLNEDLLRQEFAALYHKKPQGKYGARLRQAAH